MPQMAAGNLPSKKPSANQRVKEREQRPLLTSLSLLLLLLGLYAISPASGSHVRVNRPLKHIPVPIHNKYQPPAVDERDEEEDEQLASAATRSFTSHESYGSASLLKVLNLNAWGLLWPWSKDRTYRFKALREIIAASDYDIILLQEVWFRQDYDILSSSVPYVTFFESFNKGCTGYFLPIECSGLMILSRHPIETVEFRPFSYRGSFWNFDGEIFVAKGVGRARIRWNGLKVDVFTSHFVSYTRNPNIDNSYFRFTQAVETRRYIEQSGADIKLFGGDMNALPLHGPKQPYGILNEILNDTLTDIYPDASYHPWFATFGNLQNSYTREALPERIDYLMYWAAPGLHMRTSKFVMPMFITRNKKRKLVSLSDHEALHVEFLVGVSEYHHLKKRRLKLEAEAENRSYGEDFGPPRVPYAPRMPPLAGTTAVKKGDVPRPLSIFDQVDLDLGYSPAFVNGTQVISSSIHSERGGEKVPRTEV